MNKYIIDSLKHELEMLTDYYDLVKIHSPDETKKLDRIYKMLLQIKASIKHWRDEDEKTN